MDASSPGTFNKGQFVISGNIYAVSVNGAIATAYFIGQEKPSLSET